MGPAALVKSKAFPLENSETSRFNGIVGSVEPITAILIVCQEACDFFMAQDRKGAKKTSRPKSLSFSVLLHSRRAVTL